MELILTRLCRQNRDSDIGMQMDFFDNNVGNDMNFEFNLGDDGPREDIMPGLMTPGSTRRPPHTPLPKTVSLFLKEDARRMCR